MFSGQTFARKQKAFLKCSIKKIPSHEVVETISRVMFDQDRFGYFLSDRTGTVEHFCHPLSFGLPFANFGCPH
jgi:hypothetical protein